MRTIDVIIICGLMVSSLYADYLHYMQPSLYADYWHMRTPSSLYEDNCHHYLRINDVIIICGLLTLYADYWHHMRTTSSLYADYWRHHCGNHNVSVGEHNSLHQVSVCNVDPDNLQGIWNWTRCLLNWSRLFSSRLGFRLQFPYRIVPQDFIASSNGLNVGS